MPLFDLFLAMLWFFLWVAWIWLLITVVADILRSPDLSGWSRAAWVLVLLVLPFLGVLAYLVVRGGGMHERGLERRAEADRAVRAYIQEVATPSTPAHELAKLAELRDAGVLSEEEFVARKEKLLAA